MLLFYVRHAEPTAKALGKEIEILDWCNETHAARETRVVDENGRKIWGFQHPETLKLFASEEVRKLDKKWYEHPAFAEKGFASGIQRVQREVDAFMLNLGYQHDHDRNGYIPVRPNEDKIALFAHQGFGMMFFSCLLDIPYPQFASRFDMGHCSVTVIEFKGKDFVLPKVHQLANDSHLFAAGVDSHFQRGMGF